jgi:hypothetical protein
MVEGVDEGVIEGVIEGVLDISEGSTRPVACFTTDDSHHKM